MSDISQAAGKVFTPEFLTLLQAIPEQDVDDKKLNKIMKEMDGCLHKKKISDCVIVLSTYLADILAQNDDVFNHTFNQIKKCKIENKTNQYIY